jgi:hypothetical protein
MSEEEANDVSLDLDNGPSEDSQPEPQAQEAPQEPQPQPTPWDSFRELPQFKGQDDRQIAAGLYQAMQREQAASNALRQYQQVLPYAQDYMANRSEFDKWKQQQAQQQQQQQQQQEEPKKYPWTPPKISESHRRYLVKDENGRDVISENAPLDARQALADHMNFRADFAHKFLDNQQMAQQQAQEIIQQTMQKRDDEQYVDQVQRENADWLFDESGENATPAGVLVHKYINQARDIGINGPRARWEYAQAMAERDLSISRLEALGQFGGQQQMAPQPEPEAPIRQEAPPQPQEDLARQNMDYLKREASRNPSRSAGSTNDDKRMPRQKMTFEQMLMGEAGAKHLL